MKTFISDSSAIGHWLATPHRAGGQGIDRYDAFQTPLVTPDPLWPAGKRVKIDCVFGDRATGPRRMAAGDRELNRS